MCVTHLEWVCDAFNEPGMVFEPSSVFGYGVDNGRQSERERERDKHKHTQKERHF